MKRKRSCSGKALLERLRGQKAESTMEAVQDQNTLDDVQDQSTMDASQDLNHESTNNEFDDQVQNVNIANEVQPKQKEEALLVKVKDTCTGEVTTRKLVATQVWHLEKTKKVIVTLNDDGQGNNSGLNLLVRFLGQVAQRSAFCPIQVVRWDLMSDTSTKAQWECVEKYFEFDYAAGIKWVFTTLEERWKAFKYKIRNKYFYPTNKSIEDILANRPSEVDAVDWAVFVHHYKNDQMKKQSEQNRKNRTMLKVSHAGGSKSNARRGHEMEINFGRKVCRSEVILATLKKKDGNYVSKEGKDVAEKILENLPKDQERTVVEGVASKINAFSDDAIGKVFGAEHPGRVRGLGQGVCPTYALGKRRHFTNFIQVGSSNQKNVEDLQKEVENLGEKLVGYEENKEQLIHTTEKLTQTTEELTQTQNKLAFLQNFLQHKFGDELSNFNINVSPS